MGVPLHKYLLIVIALGITFCTFTFFSVQQPQQLSPIEEVLNGGRSISIRVDDVIVHNNTEKILKSIKSDTFVCTNLRERNNLRTIYIITPTYKRCEQIPDLTRLSHTLMHVSSIVWLVVEDAVGLSPQIAQILKRSNINFIHLHALMPKEQQKKKVKARGVSNRNKGLEWIRENIVDTNGLIYFADDDNTYDLKLFEEIRGVNRLGMWPVGLITNYGVSSPVVVNGKVTGFYDGWIANRKFPVDMAGFAISVKALLERPKGKMPYVPGYEEDGFLKSLGFSLNDIEPKANNCTQIYVWHTQTKKNKYPLKLNESLYKTTNIVELSKLII